METVLTSDGVRIAYRVDGPLTGAALVLLHATGETCETWRPIVARLGGGPRAVSIDLRGHGASGWPGRYTLEAVRDDVVTVLDDLRLQQATLVGHSLGGVVACLVAAARPDVVVRLVLEDACPPYARDTSAPDRPEGELAFDWDLVAQVRAQLDDPDRRYWPLLNDIAAHTLVIGGGPTSPVPQHLLAEVVSAVPDAELTTIPVGHLIHDTAPDRFVEALGIWLVRHPLT